MERYINEKQEIDENVLALKNARIQKELKRLLVIFANLTDNVKKTAKSLIENVAFMGVTLEDLQLDINTNGAVEEYQNGKDQWGRKKSASVEVHMAMTKNHMQCTKMLVDLLGKQQGSDGNDGFDAFVNSK